jgi:hypothetical protein
MVEPVSHGRGAWSSQGKDNGSRFYTYIAGKPLDGGKADIDVNYQAVNFGVRAIQNRINSFGHSPGLVADGVFGMMTSQAVKWMQTNKLHVFADGVVGPMTCKAMWRDLIVWFAAVHAVPAPHMYGFMALESSGDPGAVGYTTPSDRGLNQINLVAHTNITVEQAFDPNFSIDYTAKRLRGAREKFSMKGPDLQTKCSIAQHNSPKEANELYLTGQWPSERIRLYVEKVLDRASLF